MQYSNWTQKKTDSSKTVCQTKYTLQEALWERGTLYRIKGYTDQQDITVLNLHVPEIITLKGRKHKLTELKRRRQIHNHSRRLYGRYLAQLLIEQLERKILKNVDLENTLNKLDPVNT